MQQIIAFIAQAYAAASKWELAFVVVAVISMLFVTATTVWLLHSNHKYAHSMREHLVMGFELTPNYTRFTQSYAFLVFSYLLSMAALAWMGWNLAVLMLVVFMIPALYQHVAFRKLRKEAKGFSPLAYVKL